MSMRYRIRTQFARPASRPIRKGPPRARLVVEVLEERWVLSPLLGTVEPLTAGPSSTATTIENFTTDADISGPVALGTTINDSATVIGSPMGFAPTGTVTYDFYTNATASGSPAFTETVAVGTESSPQGPLAAGSYSYRAIYNGDSNYLPSTSTAEPVTVNPGTTTTATTIENFTTDADVGGPVALGTTVNDSATVTGSPAAFAPTGTVTYNFYTNATASGAPAFTETVAVGTESSPEGPLAAGSYSFQAVYNGDSNYTPSTGAVEPLTVSSGTTTTATTIENFTTDADISGPVASGTTVNDSATVIGSPAAFAPTGTVTYNFYTNATASGAAAFTETLPLGTESSPQGPLAAGSYSYQAVYNGDSNYTPSTGAVEPLTVNKATPTVNTSQHPATTSVGFSIADTATVAGGFNATGTVTFDLYNNPNGIGAPLFTDTEPLVGGAAVSKGYTTTMTGTDYWVATYNGDSNNNAVTSGKALEPVTVTPTILLLDTSGRDLSASGSAVLSASDASIFADSSSTKAIVVSGNGDVQAADIDVAGGVSVNGNGTISNVATGQTAVADPFASLPAPSGLTVQSSSRLQINSGNVVLQPGIYIGGMNISGSAVVTLMPGIYSIQGGGFTVSNQATVSGQGVVLYNAAVPTAGQISVSGSASVTLSPPTTGTYAGISIFQDRTNASAINISGSARLKVSGIIYAASAQMNISGTAVVDASGGSLFVDDLSMSGRSDLLV